MSYQRNVSPFSATSLDSRDSTSNGSAMSTSMSPMSANMSSPESAQYGISELDLNLNNYTNLDESSPLPLGDIIADLNVQDTPYLVILEQPVEKFRFRYRSEMMGTHGSLMGRSSAKGKKEYPTVELRNYSGEAIIRCSLYQVDQHNRTPHTHQLVLRNLGSNEESSDPHDVLVNPSTGYAAVYPGMGIIHTAKKYIAAELVNKRVTELKRGNYKITQILLQEIKDRAHHDARTMNLNSVCLCFEAFEANSMEPICGKVFSTSINNMKSALTGELKICRLSKVVSSCLGGEEIFMFVEKVGKKNIKVRFYELNDNDEEVWHDFGNFSELDVHHQYAIALRTPPYRDTEIERPVTVFVQLFRPSDGDVSEPISFQYQPSQRITKTERKRARTDSVYNSAELRASLPTVLPNSPGDEFVLSNKGEYLSGESYSSLSNICIGIPEQMNSDEFNNFMASLQNEFGDTVPNIMMNTETCNLTTDGYTSTDAQPRVVAQGPMEEIVEFGAIVGSGSDDGKMFTVKPQMMDVETTITPFEYNETTIKFQLNTLLKLCRSTTLRFDKHRLANNKEAVKDLFLSGQDGNTLLHIAIQRDHMTIVKDMLTLLVHYNLCHLLNKKNDQGKSILHTVVDFGRFTYIKPLMAAGMDPNLTDNYGNTALHCAVRMQSLPAVTNLISKMNHKSIKNIKVDIDKTTSEGKTALHLATASGQQEMVEKLLVAQANINTAEDLLGNTALHIAVEGNHEQIVKLLLICSNIKVNAFNRQGHTPLHLACVVDTGSTKGSEAIVKMLLEAKANPCLVYYLPPDKQGVKEEPKSDEEEDTDTEATAESCSSFELASSNPAILKLLTKYTIDDGKPYYLTPNIELMENSDIEVRPDLISMVKEEISPNITFDEECTIKLSQLLDKSGKWKELAELLDYTTLISFMKDSESPTKVLLGHIENAGVSLEVMLEHLRSVKEQDAIEIIDAMILRQNACK